MEGCNALFHALGTQAYNRGLPLTMCNTPGSPPARLWTFLLAPSGTLLGESRHTLGLRHVLRALVLAVHARCVSSSTFDAGEQNPCHQRQADQDEARHQEQRADDRMPIIHHDTAASKKYEGASKIHGSASIRFMHAMSTLCDA